MSNNTALPPLKGAALVLVTLALSMATFMQMLDSTISNVAIPTISGFLGASTDEGTWVITSFGVANAISIPVTGRLAQRFGERKLFLTSVTLFALASLCCGLSTNLDTLIGFRVVQGLVAGPLIPLSQKSAATQLSTGKTQYRTGALVNDGYYRSHFWAHYWWLHLR
ncbi:multidrug resistance protein B [Klebsiella aerogenes]|nr:multidrug resistance protein B [Klebsiella aerogenes]